jgi:hypothetical protein
MNWPSLKNFSIPTFASTEQAVEWGSRLDVKEHARLIKALHAMSNAALGEWDLQRKVSLATQSQLMREAAGAFAAA